jgi:hypothetical protein
LLEPRRVEQIPDQPGEALALADDAPDALDVGWGARVARRAPLEELGLRDDRGEWRLEIVRGGREEVLFEARGLFACPDTCGVVDERAALQDDRGLIGEEFRQLDIAPSEDRWSAAPSGLSRIGSVLKIARCSSNARPAKCVPGSTSTVLPSSSQKRSFAVSSCHRPIRAVVPVLFAAPRSSSRTISSVAGSRGRLAERARKARSSGSCQALRRIAGGAKPR